MEKPISINLKRKTKIHDFDGGEEIINKLKNIVKSVKSNVNFIKINHTKTNRKNNKSTNKTKTNYIKDVKLVIKWATKAPDTPNKTKIKPSACMQKV